jgi:hypothetical protein
MVSATSPSYLDLGGALAACGLIFAAYQLRKPEWVVALGIRGRWQGRLPFVLGLLGLIVMLARVVVAQIPPCYLKYPLNNLWIYEVLAYLLFIASPLALIYFATTKDGLFTENTAERFYDVMLKEISQSNPGRLNAALEILMANFDDICKYAGNDALNRERGQYARAILEVILSDESAIRLVTTKRLDMLVYTFGVAEKHSLSRAQSGTGIPRLVGNLYSDKESFLYKQMEGAGLAIPSNIYDAIFGSPVILNGFNLFAYPAVRFTMRAHLASEEVEVFVECLTKSIETYLVTGEVPARHLNSGISHLSEMFNDSCFKISNQERRGVDTKYSLANEWAVVSRIARFLGNDYLFIATNKQIDEATAQAEAGAADGKFSSNTTINDGIAAAIYMAFEQLAYCDKSVDVYHTVVQLLGGLMFHPTLREGYRKPFEGKLWMKIGQNVRDRYYPAVLRTYLTFFAHCLAWPDQPKGWAEEQTERLRRLLYIDLKPLLDNHDRMVNEAPMKEALLPESMDYVGGQYFYMSGNPGKTKTAIPPPPSDAKSALEGVAINEGVW